MDRRKYILTLAALTGGSISVLGTNAFTSTAAKRGVTVEVVPDNKAFIGYEIRADVDPHDSESDAEFPEFVVTAGESERRPLVSIINQISNDATLEIEDVELTQPDDEDSVITDIDITWDDDNAIADIDGKIECDEPGQTLVELTVTVSGTNVEVTIDGRTDTRRFVVRCEPDGSPDLTNAFLPRGSGAVEFDGLGQLKLLHEDSGTVDVQFYVRSNQGQNNEVIVKSSDPVDTNHKIGGQRFSSESVVGVRIGNSDAIYLHAGWNQEECGFDNGSGGIVSTPASLEKDTDPTECSSS